MKLLITMSELLHTVSENEYQTPSKKNYEIRDIWTTFWTEIFWTFNTDGLQPLNPFLQVLKIPIQVPLPW